MQYSSHHSVIYSSKLSNTRHVASWPYHFLFWRTFTDGGNFFKKAHSHEQILAANSSCLRFHNLMRLIARCHRLLHSCWPSRQSHSPTVTVRWICKCPLKIFLFLVKQDILITIYRRGICRAFGRHILFFPPLWKVHNHNFRHQGVWFQLSFCFLPLLLFNLLLSVMYGLQRANIVLKDSLNYFHVHFRCLVFVMHNDDCLEWLGCKDLWLMLFHLGFESDVIWAASQTHGCRHRDPCRQQVVVFFLSSPGVFAFVPHGTRRL